MKASFLKQHSSQMQARVLRLFAYTHLKASFVVDKIDVVNLISLEQIVDKF